MFDVLLFLTASAALALAPGPDNLFILTVGVTRGRRPAILTAWGMCTGILVHTTAAALGISAIFHASPLAFDAVRFAGVGYLLYLAVRTYRHRSGNPASGEPVPSRALFRRGFWMNVLNPKVALFFLAFLPQFVTHGTRSVPLQMVLLGLLFLAQAVVLFTGIGWFSGSIGEWTARSPRVGRAFDWLTIAVFVALAAHLATPG